MKKILGNRLHITMLIFPSMLLITLFIIFPLVITVVLSFFDTDGFTRFNFVGLQNIKNVMLDTTFWKATGRSWYLGFLAIVFDAFGGFAVAIILSRFSKRTQKIFRLAFLFPMLLSIVVVSQIWLVFFDYKFGVVNAFLGAFGLESWQKIWLLDPKSSLFCVAFVGMWQCFGLYVLFGFAAINNIPEQYFEAAKIDGANFLQMTVKITVPLLMENLKSAIIMMFVAGFYTFAQIQIMTGGGPGDLTQTVMMYIYKNVFSYQDFGYGTTLALVSLLQTFMVVFCINKFVARERISV